jgi:hypothetical protein
MIKGSIRGRYDTSSGEQPLLDLVDQVRYDEKLLVTTLIFRKLVKNQQPEPRRTGTYTTLTEYEPIDMGVRVLPYGCDSSVTVPLVMIPRRKVTASAQDSPDQTTYSLKPQVVLEPGTPFYGIEAYEPSTTGYHSLSAGARPTDEARVNLDRFREMLDQVVQAGRL